MEPWYVALVTITDKNGLSFCTLSEKHFTMHCQPVSNDLRLYKLWLSCVLFFCELLITPRETFFIIKWIVPQKPILTVEKCLYVFKHFGDAFVTSVISLYIKVVRHNLPCLIIVNEAEKAKQKLRFYRPLICLPTLRLDAQVIAISLLLFWGALISAAPLPPLVC